MTPSLLKGGTPPMAHRVLIGSLPSCFAVLFAVTLIFFLGLKDPARAASDAPDPLPMPEVSTEGSVVTLTFSIPKKPAGIYLHLSVDRGRLLGRRVRAGRPLILCIGRLAPGGHRIGYELAGKDQIVHTDEVGIHVRVPGGEPFSCQSTTHGS